MSLRKSISINRVVERNKEILRYIELLENTLIEKNFINKLKNILNIDQSGFQMKTNSESVVAIKR